MDIAGYKGQAICHSKVPINDSPSDRRDDVWSRMLRLMKDVYCRQIRETHSLILTPGVACEARDKRGNYEAEDYRRAALI